MDRIRFPCPSCSAKLSVGPDLRGRGIVCPKCHQKALVPAFEVVEASEPPAPLPQPAEPPAEMIRFPCSKCGVKLRAPADQLGRAVPCPKCGENTVVPEKEEVGSYG